MNIKHLLPFGLSLALALTGCAAAVPPGNQTGPASGPEESRETDTGGEPAVLHFSSFAGGGHVYSARIADPDILSCETDVDYGPAAKEPESGARHNDTFVFAGLRPGETTVTIYGESPIMDNDNYMYRAVVDEGLNVTLESLRVISDFYLYRSGDDDYITCKISLTSDGYVLSVNDEAEQGIGEETAKELLRVIEEYGLDQWDGFDEEKNALSKEESFWMIIRYTDGVKIEARGDSAVPEHFQEAADSIHDILDKALAE
ncbi:MAG: hypothetical protein J6P87_02180 [Lachnospiraceae bacterium]|nr:hypothetical protein [Lachnospiraceae bacterium]